MKIIKAIENINIFLNDPAGIERDDFEDSIKLGIEAMKYYQQERERRGAIKTMWLPGETEE